MTLGINFVIVFTGRAAKTHDKTGIFQSFIATG